MTTDTTSKPSKPSRSSIARPKTVQLTIRINPDILAQVEEAAAERIISRDILIGKAIETFLGRLRPVGDLLTQADSGLTGLGAQADNGGDIATFTPRPMTDNPQA